ncbi:MAG TPA: hypothetical protein PK239_15480 [Chitinophagales bacterium]|nr:hypothetical protein [Chitinophagales bacterium]
MKKNYLLLLLFVVVLSACNQAKETKEKVELGKQLQEMGENIEKGMEESAKKQEARRAAGDTLPLHFSDLKNYLPKAIAGFTPDGEPKGQTMNFQGASYSATEQRFVDSQGNSITVMIQDYNGLPELYGMATMTLKTKMTFENDEQWLKTLHLGIEDVGALETYNKSSKDATVVVGVGDRFFISISGAGLPDTEKLKTVAKSLPLQEMAKM